MEEPLPARRLTLLARHWRLASTGLFATGILAAGVAVWLPIPDRQSASTASPRSSSFSDNPAGTRAHGAASSLDAVLLKPAGSEESFSLQLHNRTETERVILASIAVFDDRGEALVPHDPSHALEARLEAQSDSVLSPVSLVRGLPDGYYYAEAVVSSDRVDGDESAFVDEQTSSTLYFAVTDAKVEVVEAAQWMRESRILEGQALPSPVRARISPELLEGIER